jgi:NitT/TauT family transport system substrate-binding protein
MRLLPLSGLTVVTLALANPASAQTKVDLHLEFLVHGAHAMFYLAQEKGWYRDAGLDLTITPGKGTADAINTVGVGNAQFGSADYGAVARSVLEGIPIRAVATFFYETPAGIVSFADKPVKVPKDLEGKSISVAPFGASTIMFPAFIKINNVDLSKVKVETYNFGAMVPSFLAGKTDSTLGFTTGEYLWARNESKNRPVIALRFADFGIKTYGNGLIVNNDFMEKNPKLVQAFVKTTVKAAQYTYAHPDEAVAATAKHTEKAANVVREELMMSIELMDTQEARSTGYGIMTPDRWASTQRIQVEYGGQKAVVPDSQLWTNKFLQ